MKKVTILDKEFELFIESNTIQENIKRIATDINNDLEGKNPIFVAILNGSFMFAGDLMKHVTIPSEITFVRIASYKGVRSTKDVKEVLGLVENIKDRTVVIVEDIVDTGHTIEQLISQFELLRPKEIKIATLLFKPEALVKGVKPDFVALEIPNDFVVGFGLDYDGFGRNLRDIYKIKP
ncbi:MAG: hypoxanthine phosphoribosyltransferase [Dysgonamonadaceae bacterium]|jgi:hypoxanthine phosphoribosyltransferase|nr:hypoxanthine phosphoribosyltransferase [Dysgonamonadaceae bacterium]MDD3728179.1 hypoxanthine phosphoribosyltransferase [Dysgonamonadaceae bacterium]MDD4247092.1 hypoxanthine phosphoribosyltransferase [Dysgonamonadaceae bacterium]